MFDQSSGHCTFREDTLNVNRMNVGSRGTQSRMTMWDGKVQKLFFSDGRPKERGVDTSAMKVADMRLVLQERGVDTSAMKVADMRLVPGSLADFKNETTALEHVVQEKQQRAIYIYLHCELNPIERVSGEAKRYIYKITL